MKDITASFPSTSVSPELVQLSENVNHLIGYHAAIFDRGERFRSPSTPEAKHASRFLVELKKASAYVRMLLIEEPAISAEQLEKRVRQYVDEKTFSSRAEGTGQRAMIDVGERLLGFVQEIRRKTKMVEKLAA